MLDRGSDAVGHWQSTRTLGIILHAACNAWGNAIITFFTPFDKKSSSEHQTLFPIFGEGSGHKTRGRPGNEASFEPSRIAQTGNENLKYQSRRAHVRMPNVLF